MTDVLDELRPWAKLKVGDPMPTAAWGPPLTATLRAAIEEIEQLRAHRQVLLEANNKYLMRAREAEDHLSKLRPKIRLIKQAVADL